MTQLLLGLALFLGTHSISVVALPWRDRIAAKHPVAWRGLYSLIALIGLVLIVRGYAEVRQIPDLLYVSPDWMRHVAALLLLPVFVLLLASVLPGRIQRAAKHPLLVAVKLWALAHLLVNGAVADVLLFGSFLVWAVLVRISLKRRPARKTPSVPESKFNDAIVLVGGIGLYFATALWLHQLLFGVRPFT